MSSRNALSQIPVAKRRKAAATLGLFATLFVAIAAVSATGPSSPVITAFVAIAVVVAVLLALLAWGVATSITSDAAAASRRESEGRLDAAIEAAVVATGQPMCGCGHEHDPSELHVPDDPCARDGHGAGCTHSCETCVLATLKRTSERSARPSPAPGPRRPSPVPHR